MSSLFNYKVNGLNKTDQINATVSLLPIVVSEISVSNTDYNGTS